MRKHGAKNDIKRKIGLVLLVVFLCAFLVLPLLHEEGHCDADHCLMCSFIHQAKQFCKSLFAVFILAGSIVLGIWVLGITNTFARTVGSPIKNHVQMNH